jgi:hypothetical protein
MIIAQFLNQFQLRLIDSAEYVVEEPLTDKMKELLLIWEAIDFSSFIRSPFIQMFGRPEYDRRSIAKAFIGKAVYNLQTTSALVEKLVTDRSFRMLCGFESTNKVPSESTFSRAFTEFSILSLGEKIHQFMVKKYVGDQIVLHVSRDSSEVDAREKVVKIEETTEPKEEVKPKYKRGRPKKGEERPAPEPTVLEKQLKEKDPMVSINELPKDCNWGCKKDSNGKKHSWKGYKIHVDWADGEVPLTALLTSASVHDSQVAIPLSQITSARCIYIYELMDAAYDAAAIRMQSEEYNHIPIIDANKRNGEVPAEKLMDPATKKRYNNRTTAERGNSMLKDGFGLRNLRVRGSLKANMHVMFGIIALFASRIIRPINPKKE